MVCSWYQEIAMLLALLRSDIAIGCEFEITTWEFILGIFIDIKLFFVFTSFKLVTLEEHLNFQAQIVLVGISADSKVVEPVFLVHSIFHVVEVPLVDFKEFVILRVISKFNRL